MYWRVQRLPKVALWCEKRKIVANLKKKDRKFLCWVWTSLQVSQVIVFMNVAHYSLFTEQKRRLKEVLLQDLKEEEEQKKNDGGFQKPHSKVDKKALRISDETPTYTGGVSDEARNRLENRQHRDKQRKFQVTSKVLRSLNFIGILPTCIFFSCSPKVTNAGMKAQSSNVQVTEEMTEASERTANDPDVQTTAGNLPVFETSLLHPKFTSRALRPDRAGTTMTWQPPKDGRKTRPREENVVCKPTLQNAVTEEAVPTGQKEAIAEVQTGPKEEIVVALIGRKDAVQTNQNVEKDEEVLPGPKGSPILITSKQNSI